LHAHQGLSHQPTSAGKNAASDGLDMGAGLSKINMDDFMAGDFNGGGRRDVPAWPPQP